MKFSLKDIKIDNNLFFKIGVGCFLIIGCADLGNLLWNFSKMNFFGIAIGVAKTFFDFVIAAFFWTMYNKTSDGNFSSSIDSSEEEINKALEEAKK